MEDCLAYMGSFLTHREMFLVATVNKEWRDSQYPNKRLLLNKLKNDVFMTHAANNCCPCILEKFYQQIIDDFRLKRYMCSLIEGKQVPDWLYKYISSDGFLP